jgi:hypothetical protein
MEKISERMAEKDEKEKRDREKNGTEQTNQK